MNTRAFLSYITLSIAISLSACSNLAVVETSLCGRLNISRNRQRLYLKLKTYFDYQAISKKRSLLQN